MIMYCICINCLFNWTLIKQLTYSQNAILAVSTLFHMSWHSKSCILSSWTNSWSVSLYLKRPALPENQNIFVKQVGYHTGDISTKRSWKYIMHTFCVCLGTEAYSIWTVWFCWMKSWGSPSRWIWMIFSLAWSWWLIDISCAHTVSSWWLFTFNSCVLFPSSPHGSTLILGIADGISVWSL